MARHNLDETGLMDSLAVGMQWTAGQLQHIKQQQQQQQQQQQDADCLLYMRAMGLSMLQCCSSLPASQLNFKASSASLQDLLQHLWRASHSSRGGPPDDGDNKVAVSYLLLLAAVLRHGTSAVHAWWRRLQCIVSVDGRYNSLAKQSSSTHQASRRQDGNRCSSRPAVVAAPVTLEAVQIETRSVKAEWRRVAADDREKESRLRRELASLREKIVQRLGRYLSCLIVLCRLQDVTHLGLDQGHWIPVYLVMCVLVSAGTLLRCKVNAFGWVRLLGSADNLSVQELLDGVINVVYAVHGPAGSVLVKQALPYVRAVGESFPLSRERMDVEAAAMQLLHSCCPAHVPQLLLYNASSSVLAMQYLPPPHQKLLYAIRQGQVLPGLAGQLAQLLSCYLARSSLQVLQPDQAAAVMQHFSNSDIVSANEQVVLIGPFNPQDPSNRWTSPQLDAAVQAMWADEQLQAAAADMLRLYRSSKQALIHNDLHAGNLLVAPGSLYLIDWEFATTGPIAFDLGCLLGNLMLAVLSLQGMEQAEQQQQQHLEQHGGAGAAAGCANRQQQAEWLLQVMRDTWIGFQQQYPTQLAAAQAAAAAGGGLFAADAAAGLLSAAAAGQQQQLGVQQSSAAGAAATLDEQYWQQLLRDSCGYAGCCIIRLTIGLHHYPDIQDLPDPAVRSSVELRCLQLGQQLLRLRQQPAAAAAAAAAAAGADAAGDDGGAAGCAADVGGQNRLLDIQQVVQLVREACVAADVTDNQLRI
ncbi:hypothetical protein OEZ85_012679 [Tetradesmus obliquus]|uniref:S-methyl-5-thioribose kinase n=1 Tax=Tetradesmus obliquus TaxID=3088 RepID=A0ABY8U417_TETOB|nr:hypothetical protein OEZ85_012679 [Tetradesmus obliquus]